MWPWTESRLRRSAQRLAKKSNRAIARRRWHLALRYSLQAEEALDRAKGYAPPDLYDTQLLATLYFNRAGIQETLGDLIPAKRSAERAWQLYLRIDPTDARASQVVSVLKVVQAPVIVTDYRTVRAMVDQHARRQQQIEQAIAQTADAWIRHTRLQSLMDRMIYESATEQELREQAERVREQGGCALDTYRELIRVGHFYSPADLARVQAEYDAALAAWVA